jgi:hypothetical protein
MFRQFQRIVTLSVALVVCAAIFYVVSLLYNHIGAVATKITATPKPSAGVVYVMTFKNGAPTKPSQGSKANSSKSQGESPH